MKSTKILVHVLVLVLAVTLLGPAAIAGKKKKPKPYKSDAHALAVSHTLLISSTGDRNNVTLKEFENRCEIPASQGFDAVVYEVPKEYQSIQSNVTTGTTATQAYDLYLIMYDKNCQYKFHLGAVGSVAQANASGAMPAGIAYVGIANFAGEPADVWWEAKP